MRNLFSLQARKKISRVVACAVLLNLNAGWVQLVASDVIDNSDEALCALQQQVRGVREREKAPRQEASKPGDLAQPVKVSQLSDLELVRDCICTIRDRIGKGEFHCQGEDQRTVFEFLEKILSILCEQKRDECKNIGKPLCFPSDCDSPVCCGDEQCDKKTVYEFLYEILRKLCAQKPCPPPVEDCCTRIGEPECFPTECDKADSHQYCEEKTVFQFLKEILRHVCKEKPCPPAENCCTKIGEPECFPYQCYPHEDKNLCEEKTVFQFLKEILRRQCEQKPCPPPVEDCCTRIGEPDCFPTECDGCEGQQYCDEKTVFQFLKEILRRVCHVKPCPPPVENCCSLIGEPACFPTECEGIESSCDSDSDKRTVFQFLTEILKRICEIECQDCATEKEVQEIVCSKVDQAVKTICDKISHIPDDCATPEDIDQAVSTICVKINNLQATLCSKIEAIDCETDISIDKTILSKVCDLYNCIIENPKDDCDAECIKDRVKTIQTKVCNIQKDVRKSLDKICDLYACLIDDCDCDSDPVCLKDRIKTIESKVCEILEIIEKEGDIEQTILSKLDDCCLSLNSKIDGVHNEEVTIQSLLDQCCNTLNSKIDILINNPANNPCASTPIYGPTTITASGSYCLANDVNGASPAIVISANSVVLNLNGHIVTNSSPSSRGIEISAGVSDVTIFNGSVIAVGNAVNSGVGICACLGSNKAIRIQDVTIKKWSQGITVDSATQVILNGVIACNNLDGVRVNNSAGFEAHNCLFNANNDNGVEVVSSSGIRFEACHFDEDGQNGVLFENSSCGQFVNCSALGNNASEDGFNIKSVGDDAASSVLLNNCYACGYVNGFNGSNVSDLNIVSCVAKGNTENGFTLNGTANTAIVRGCTASGNGLLGFEDDGNGLNNYFSNVACQNGPTGAENYSLTINEALVTSSANAKAFQNVDCSSTEVDQLESKLDACCATLNTKIDGVISDLDACCSAIENNFQTVFEDFRETWTILGGICSKIEEINCTFDTSTIISKLDEISNQESTLASQLDACCQQLNSKADVITVDLSNCCFTLNSKIDLINCQVDTSTIESKLDACCVTLNSKVDATNDGINSVSSQVSDCCFTLNSKIDQINCNVDTSTIISKLDGITGKVCAIETDLDACCSAIENNFQTVFEDFRETWTVLGNICSKIEAINCNLDVSTIESKLDACCATLNSKIDYANQGIDSVGIQLADCCTNLNTKIDNVTTEVTSVGSQVSDCCFTLNSKIDQINCNVDTSTIISKLDGITGKVCAIETELDACCATLNSKIDQINCNVDTSTIISKIDQANSAIDACCGSLNSKIDIILQTNCTLIVAPTTITLPGTYCLGADINGASPAIVINASNVVLDLAGHKVTNSSASSRGIEIGNNVTDVTIKNGAVVALGNAVNSGVGICACLGGNQSIRIENVTIKNWDEGISIVDTNKVTLSGIITCNNVTGVAITNSVGIQASNSLFNNNIEDGASILSCSGIHFDACNYDANGQNGVLLQNSSCAEIVQCSALGNGSTEDGFNVRSVGNGVVRSVLLKDCYACGYVNGFRSSNAIDLNIINCVAKGNSENGILLAGYDNSAIVRGCTSSGNTLLGFADDGQGSNKYYSNVACDNGTNYAAVVNNAQVKSSATAGAFQNVDCGLTDSDQLESKLDACCATLNSKIDSANEGINSVGTQIADCCTNLNTKIDLISVDLNACCSAIENNFQTVFEDFNQTWTVLGGICSKIEAINCNLDVSTIESKLDACCATLNSKIDYANQGIDSVGIQLADCCTNLNTKIDNVNTEVTSVGSQVADCCFTLNSKIDNINFNVDTSTIISKLDDIRGEEGTIESKLDACCTNLSTKIDILNIDLDACCVAIENNFQTVFEDFRETWTVLGGICSKIEAINCNLDVSTIESKLDECCATLNSKIDYANQGIDSVGIQLADCCTNLNTKIDNVNTEVTSVGSQVAACCFTLNSKIDNINFNVDTSTIISKLDDIRGEEGTIESKLDACCTNLSTKIDILNIDLDACCVAIENNFQTVFEDFRETWTVLGGICSKIEAINCNLDVSTIESKLDACCTTLNAKVDVANEGIISVGSQVTDCCFTLNSKIDNINFNVDTSTIISKLDGIRAEEGTIESKLDACCATLNSKIDQINCNVDLTTVESKLDACCVSIENNFQVVFEDFRETWTALDACCNTIVNDLSECCFTLNSKIDNINCNVDTSTIISKLDGIRGEEGTIESKLDACCTTLNAKVDVANEGIISVGSQVADCCFTLNSKIDNINCNVDTSTIISKLDGIRGEEGTIESKLDACCATLNSKIDVLNVDLDACCLAINNNFQVVFEDFRETWTALDACCNTIVKDLSECCFTLNSKIDNINCNVDTSTIISKLDGIRGEEGTIESKLDACCTTLNAKVDVANEGIISVGSQVADCCFTLNSKIDQINCNVDLSTVESKLDSCCVSIENNFQVVFEDFRETWTALDGCCNTITKDLAECCFTLNSKIDNINVTVDTSTILSKLCVLDTKVDNLTLDVQATWTIIDACCSTMNANFQAVFNDFQETWTLIGDTNATVPNLVDTVIDVNLTNTFSVMQWLKLIYAKIQ